MLSFYGTKWIHGQTTESASIAKLFRILDCILPHCRLRDWCGNLRKASGHVVCRLDQSASFRIFDSTFYFPHSAIPHFTHSRKHVELEQFLACFRVAWVCHRQLGFLVWCSLTGLKYSCFFIIFINDLPEVCVVVTVRYMLMMESSLSTYNHTRIVPCYIMLIMCIDKLLEPQHWQLSNYYLWLAYWQFMLLFSAQTKN